MNFALFLERRSKRFWGVIGFLLVAVLSWIDYITGYEIIISLFYLIPIAAVSWYGSRRMGMFICAEAALAVFFADFIGGLEDASLVVYIWNTLLWVSFFFAVAWLVSLLRRTYNENRQLARTDYVTGAASIRFFYDLARLEIARAERYKRPFTFVYVDIDNFKSINDRLGHSVGDRVLKAVTAGIQRQIRSVDVLGRLGGDEFALLLPETDTAEAQEVIARMHNTLAQEMRKNGWEVTFSMGTVTYLKPPASVDEMVRLGDEAMYSIKTASKNGVAYRQYAG